MHYVGNVVWSMQGGGALEILFIIIAKSIVNFLSY